jgi:hypothetical protein
MFARFARIRRLFVLLNSIDHRLGRLQESLGRIERRQVTSSAADRMGAVEFWVFSQWGEVTCSIRGS